MSRSLTLSKNLGYNPAAWLWRVSLVLVLFAALSVQGLAQELPNFRALVKQYGPAVVNIRSKGMIQAAGRFALPPDIPEPFRRFFEELPGHGVPHDFRAASQGSGFILTQDGYILTNAHVVADAKEVFVKLNDRREYPAKVVGVDDYTDVALLKIDARKLPAVKVGDANQLEVGDWVLAIGSPFGFERTATQGIVSALSRSLPDGTYVPFIQTDVAVNPGNSGGPLFDTNGNVVGINSQIFSRSGGYMGLSFAIPINVATEVAEQLKTQGYVNRGWLGVAIQDMNQTLAESFGLERPQGALVSGVTANSPASKAGVKSGDVIIRFNGKTIERASELPPLVGATTPGTQVPVTVQRDGRTRTLTITVATLENQPEQLAKNDAHGDRGKRYLGLTVADISAQQRKALDLEDRGVLVEGLEPDSLAAEAGIRPADVILSFDHRDVKSVAQLSKLVQQVSSGKPVAVLVQRDQNQLFLPILIPGKGIS